MLVLGSKSSANTQKLVEICKKHCKNTENIDVTDKLFLDKLPSDDIIGIVAGASTPDRMIWEVLQVMSEQEKTTIETIEAAAPAEDVVVPQEPQMTEETAAAEAAVEATPEAAPKAEEETVEAKAEAEVIPAQKEKKAPKKKAEINCAFSLPRQAQPRIPIVLGAFGLGQGQARQQSDQQ